MAGAVRIASLIVEQLARGEMEVLSLVVAVRRTLRGFETPKGDLVAMVRSALKRLVASNTVLDHDGRYSLPPPK